MKIPKLEKKRNVTNLHGYEIIDDYSWVHQKDILEVLTDKKKLLPEVRDYLEKENDYTTFNLKDTKKTQDILFNEIKGRIKLDDESLKFIDKDYTYWSKYEKGNNYTNYLRQNHTNNKIEVYWNGDEEAKGKTFFSLGDIEVSDNDKLLAYSVDDKGSELYKIKIRNLDNNKDLDDEITHTSGSITWSYDSKFIFYSKRDKNHRPRQIYRHKIGTKEKEDMLIYEEMDKSFSCSIDSSSDEKYYFISTSDHTTSEVLFFSRDEDIPKPKIIRKRQRDILYSANSWNNELIIRTNLDALDFKICKSKHSEPGKWIDYIPAKEQVIIGGCTFLKKWMIRSEVKDALSRVLIRDLETEKESELSITDETVISPSIALYQKDKNTDNIYIGYESPKTPVRIYKYNIATQEKKLVKEKIIPSGHNSKNYIVKRLNAKSRDNKSIPLTITYHKDTLLNGDAKLLLYGYGSYGSSMYPSFSTSALSLINRGIIWVTAHIRGGSERGMSWWLDGKMMNKKNTFNDYIDSAEFLIKEKYTSEGNIIGYGGSAGGLLMGAVVNEKPNLFLGMILAVPFVDSLTTNLDHTLPLTAGEFFEFGNAKENKQHFEYILSYTPYHNIKKQNYPNMLITTSLNDSRVLFDEPLKFTAKLRDFKTDQNLLLLKTEMEAGHGGKSGRDASIKEIAFDYSFILKICKLLST